MEEVTLGRLWDRAQKGFDSFPKMGHLLTELHTNPERSIIQEPSLALRIAAPTTRFSRFTRCFHVCSNERKDCLPPDSEVLVCVLGRLLLPGQRLYKPRLCLPAHGSISSFLQVSPIFELSFLPYTLYCVGALVLSLPSCLRHRMFFVFFFQRTWEEVNSVMQLKLAILF